MRLPVNAFLVLLLIGPLFWEGIAYFPSIPTLTHRTLIRGIAPGRSRAVSLPRRPSRYRLVLLRAGALLRQTTPRRPASDIKRRTD